jgi:hypothetical protein
LLLDIVGELLPPEVPLKTRHLLGFSIVGQCLLYRFHRPIGKLLVGDDEYSSYQADQLADQITRFSLGGIQAVAEAHRPVEASS